MRASVRRMLSFLISLTLLIGAAAVYGVLIAPLYSDVIQPLRSAIVSRDRQFKEQKAIIDRVSQLLEQFRGTTSFQETLSLFLPNEPFLSQTVGNIQGLASINKITLSSMQAELLPFQAAPNVPKYVKNIGTARVSFVAKGEYVDFKKFISQIETNIRIMDVKEITVSVVQQPQAQIGYEHTVVVFAYYQEKEM